MSANIPEIRNAVIEAMDNTNIASDLISQLTPLHEEAHAMCQNTHASLEAAHGGLSRYLSEVSLASQAGASAAENIDSAHNIFTTRPIESSMDEATTHAESAIGHLASAHQNREAAIEAGKEAAVEIGLAFDGLVAVVSKTREMQDLVDRPNGVNAVLVEATTTASTALSGFSHEHRQFPAALSRTKSYVSYLSIQLQQAQEATKLGNSLPSLAERLKESLIILANSHDTPIGEFNSSVRTIKEKITESDLEELGQLIVDVMAMKDHYAFSIPGQQSDLQKRIREAQKHGDQLLENL